MKKFTKRILLLLTVLAVAFSGVWVAKPSKVSAASSDGKIIVVSLGDSYASGEGIEPFFGQDKDADEKVQDEDWLAHRSQKAWSALLTVNGNKMVKDDNWFFAAASGAETKHLYEGQEKKYDYEGEKGSKKLAPQLDIFDKVEKKYGKNAVDVVTVSIGGNDIGFTDLMTSAIMSQATIDTKLAQIAELYEKTAKKNIKKAYQDIAKKAGDQAAIIVVGYPRLLCEDGFSVNAGFITMQVSAETTKKVNESVDGFNANLASLVDECRAEGLNIYYVPVIEEFAGHEAYSKDAYISEVITTRQAEDLSGGPASGYSLHPNETGAKTYAKAVQKVLDTVVKASSNNNDDKKDSTAPVVTLKAKKGKITVKWTKVEGATKYQVVKYVDGKEVVVKKSTKKTSYTVKGEKKGTECTFAVKAYVNKKWTKVTDSDKATIKAK